MTGFASGAEPTGPTVGPGSTRDEQSVSRAVQSMFNGIAPRYDLLNHVLSANVDRIWWRRTARVFAPILRNPDSAVLDLCCGTGDMTLALLRLRPANGKPVVALDFSHEMLERAKEKFASPEFSPFGVDHHGSRCAAYAHGGQFHRLDHNCLRFSKFGELRSWPPRDGSRSATRRATRHPRFQRAWRFLRKNLQPVLPPYSSSHRKDSIWSVRTLRISSALSASLSQTGRDAGHVASLRVCTGNMDTVYVWHCGPVPRCESMNLPHANVAWFRGCGE